MSDDALPAPRGPESEGPNWKAIALGLAVLAALGGGLVLFAGREQRLASMSASEARITLADADASLAEIEREKNQEVFYRVVLQEAPLGGRLHLRCEWVDPSGGVARRNRFRTRFVYKSRWPTHCRQRLGPGTPAGQWHVRLLLEDRVLSATSFLVK